MVMIHHDGRAYGEAASEAARFMRKKMEVLIDAGAAKGRQTVEHVLDSVPQDFIVKANSIKFGIEEIGGKNTVTMERDKKPLPVHYNAMKQMSDKFGMSLHYVNKLRERDDEWAQELLVHNLQTLADHDHRRYLVRAMPGRHTGHGASEARAFLSDKYRRLDSRPILGAFLESVNNYGMVPIDGTVTDVRCALKLILPYVFEPVENEITCFGLQFANSDFGAGKLSIRAWMLRLGCTNKAVVDETLSQVHLGKKLEDNIQYSKKTYELDTATTVSAVKDVVKQALEPDAVKNTLDMLRLAHEKVITDLSGNIMTKLRAQLSKEELRKVKDHFNGPDVQNLPPGKSPYRLSNAISWLANAEDVSNERKLELEHAAGEWLTRSSKPTKAA